MKDCRMTAGGRRRLLLGALAAAGLGGTRAAAALTRRSLVFPRDHGSHPDSRTEWWYLTGWLHAGEDAGTPIGGFQLTFFRSRTGFGEQHPSAFAARQLLFAHAAYTDLAHRRLLHDQRAARAGLGLAGAALDDTAIVVDRGPREWHLARHAGTGGASVYEAQWECAGVRLRLTASARHPPLLQGDAGWSRKGPGAQQASQYVSEPQLQVHGQIEQNGRARTVVGRAWLDHEWSDELLAPGVVGWDWIGMNLFDGRALTAFQLRDATGTPRWAGGSLRDSGGGARVFAAEQVHFTTDGPGWRSPTTGATYPQRWQVQTPAGRWWVQPLLAAQELDSRGSTGTAYWEGLSDLLDEAGRPVGRGYLEMTGYAGALRLDG